MKRQMKVFLGLFVFCLCLVPAFKVSALTKVSTEQELLDALKNDEQYIILTKDITTSGPIEVSKDVTIASEDGRYGLIAGYTGTDGNKTIIASTTSGTLILKDIKISNSPKYGVQAHNGGHVVLDGVTISNSGYGAALANGGTITIMNLALNSNGYGIEFGVGDGVTGTSTLVMDGTLDTTLQTGTILHVDVPEGTPLAVKNTESSEQKLVYSTDKKTIDLVGSDGTVLTSTIALDDTITVDEGTATSISTEIPGLDNPTTEDPTTEPTTPENTTDTEEVTNPKTADSILFITLALLASGGVATFAGRKLAKQRM